MKKVAVLRGFVVLSFVYAQNYKAGFRSFEHYGGTTCIPEYPKRIVTTQDQNALLPLLELGIKPVGSAGQALEDGTHRFRRVAEYDTEGIKFIGSYWGEANLEAITLLNPDLIVSDEFAEQFYDAQSRIAPAVVIQIFDRPLTDALLDFAALVGREERARALATEYQDNVRGFLERLGERKDKLSVATITVGWYVLPRRLGSSRRYGYGRPRLVAPRAAANERQRQARIPVTRVLARTRR